MEGNCSRTRDVGGSWGAYRRVHSSLSKTRKNAEDALEKRGEVAKKQKRTGGIPLVIRKGKKKAVIQEK